MSEARRVVDERVSIVIPAYNHGKYIAEAVESVLGQEYTNIEVTVVDDGSTDNTANVLAGYAERVRVISQANAGQSAAINLAWASAQGDILSYLSADDRLEPQAVSRAIAAFRAHPCAVLVYGDYHLIDPTSSFVRRVTAPDYDYTEMVRDFIAAPGPGVFVRRSAADRIDGWNVHLRQAPDYEYWLRLSLLGPFVRIPYVLAALRVHTGSASFAPTSPERAEEPVRIMESYFARTDLPPEARAVQHRSLSSAHLVAARAHLRAKRLGPGVSHIRQAARLSPRNVITTRAARLMANALMNRLAYQLLWHWRRWRSGTHSRWKSRRDKLKMRSPQQ